MIKKILIVAVTVIIVAVFVVVVYRYEIFQYSAESIIRSILPAYVEVGKIRFDFVNRTLILSDFRIENPPDFSNKYLLDVGEIRCAYGMKGKSFLEGIVISSPTFKKPVLHIERLADDKTNITRMQAFVDERTPGAHKPPAGAGKKGYGPLSHQAIAATFLGNRKASEIVQLPDRFTIEHGKVVFIDRLDPARTHMITLENIGSSLDIALNENYSGVLRVASRGAGHVNGKKDEKLTWAISLDPTTDKLTMSNRLEFDNVEIKPFEPYYDKYSPIVFVNGNFTGLLVFDFDNGNIGSTNEVRLSNLRFYVKQGMEKASFWEANVPDLVRYFTTSRGDVVFDFKIKGDMADPKFFLGPISKQAMTAYAVDKISDVVQQLSGAQQPGIQGQDSKTNVEKIKQYIDLFKDISGKK